MLRKLWQRMTGNQSHVCSPRRGTRNRVIPVIEGMEERTLLSTTGLFAVGAGPGAGPQVNVYDPATGALAAAFFAFDRSSPRR